MSMSELDAVAKATEFPDEFRRAAHRELQHRESHRWNFVQGAFRLTRNHAYKKSAHSFQP